MPSKRKLEEASASDDGFGRFLEDLGAAATGFVPRKRPTVEEIRKASDQKSMEEHGMRTHDWLLKLTNEGLEVDRLKIKPWDGIARGTREFELWSSIARWTKRTHPKCRGSEFIDKPAKQRRAMVSRLVEYLTWRLTVSREVDPISGEAIINEKTGKPKTMSAYTLIVLAMELNDIVQRHTTLYWRDEVYVKRAFQDATIDLTVKHDLSRSLHGKDQEPLIYYQKMEQDQYPDPDDEDFEAPAGEATRELEARRLEEKRAFEQSKVELIRADPNSTEDDIKNASMAMADAMEKAEAEAATRDHPADEHFAKMWDGSGVGCMSWWV